MNKERILQEIKADMKSIIDQITLDKDYKEESLQRLTVHLDFINMLRHPMLTDESTDEVGEEETPSPPEDKNEIYATFQRKLDGGVADFIGVDDSTFVPENIVNSLELKNGDILSLKPREDNHGDKKHYFFSLKERSEKEEPDEIVVVQYGVVSYNEEIGRHVIEKDVNGVNVKVNEVPQALLIDEAEALHFGLQAGDIVTVAFYSNNPGYIRVRQKLDTTAVPQPSRPMKKSEYTTKEDNEKREYPQTLVGKKVLMVGNEAESASMKEEIARRGGELEAIEGNISLREYTALLRHYDVAVISLQHCSHKASKTLYAAAKFVNKPVRNVDNYGRTTFVKAVHDGLGIEYAG